MFCHMDIYSGEFNKLLLTDGYASSEMFHTGSFV